MRPPPSFASVTAIALCIGMSCACGAKLEPVTRPLIDFDAVDVTGELVISPYTFGPRTPPPPPPPPPDNGKITHKAVHHDPYWTLQVHAYGGEFYSKATGHRTLKGDLLFATEQSWMLSGPRRPTDSALTEVRITTKHCSDGRGEKSGKNTNRYLVVVNGIEGCLEPVQLR